MALQNVDAVVKRNSFVEARMAAFKHVWLAEETEATSVSCWFLKNICYVRRRDEPGGKEERLNINLAVVCEPMSEQGAFQGQLLDAQDSSARFGACWQWAREHAKDVERRLAEVAQQVTMP